MSRTATLSMSGWTHYYKIPYHRRRMLKRQEAAPNKRSNRAQHWFVDEQSQFCAYFDDDPYLYEVKQK